MDLIKKVEEFAKPLCDKYEKDPFLWSGHTQFVRKYALILADIEKADKEVVEIAALLHDIGKHKGKENHSEKSYELAKEFFENIDVDKKELILKCILKHSRRFSMEDNEIEVKVVQSADALGSIFDDEMQRRARERKTKEELLSLYDKTLKKINLDSARKIAIPKIEELKSLIQ